MALKALANTVATGSATNVYLASAVHLANDGTARTITIANTISIENGGGQAATIRIPANGQMVIRKRPTDTVSGAAGCYATSVAEGGLI
jgi:hypothetical protein